MKKLRTAIVVVLVIISIWILGMFVYHKVQDAIYMHNIENENPNNLTVDYDENGKEK
jgi:cell division protein YceG involved in septum cleavage